MMSERSGTYLRARYRSQFCEPHERTRAYTHTHTQTYIERTFDSRVDRRVLVGQQVHAKRVKGIKIGPSIIYFTFTGTLSKRGD